MTLSEPPEYIWLQYHGDADPADYPNDPGPDTDEVSWCWEPIFEYDIKYVNASKFEELETKLKATEAIQNEQLNQCFRLEAENQRLQSELKSANKGAERNAHINMMLVDKNKRLKDKLRYSHLVSPATIRAMKEDQE